MWTPEGWKQKEWEIFYRRLEKLSVKELKIITDTIGIKFFHKNVSKDEYLNVIDEGDKEKLIKVYKEITSKKLRNKKGLGPNKGRP